MNGKGKTLIILIPGFPKDESDENCLPFPQLFVKTLQKNNPLLDIIVMAFQYPYKKAAYHWNGVTVMSFNGRSRGKLYRLMLWRSVMNEIKKTVEERHVFGFLSFWLGECALIAKRASNKYKLPFFIWLMGQDARENNHYYHLIEPQPNQLIALSDSLSDELYNNYNIKPLHVIPSGIDKEEFGVDAKERNIDIIGVGSLIKLKQFDSFIRVIAGIKKRNENVNATICGDGPEKENLKQLIEQNGLQNNITLAGEIPHREVLTIMQKSKILLHPSSYEGFATVYAEALFAGCHVVGFCKPMNRDFPHLHILKNEAQMVEKVISLLNNVTLTYESVITYSIDNTCKRILALFNQ